MADIFKSVDKVRNNIIKIRTSIKKINYKLDNIDIAKPNSDDFEKIANYFDDIKCMANRSMVKMDHIVDMDDDSSDQSSLSNMSLIDSIEKKSTADTLSFTDSDSDIDSVN